MIAKLANKPTIEYWKDECFPYDCARSKQIIVMDLNCKGIYGHNEYLNSAKEQWPEFFKYYTRLLLNGDVKPGGIITKTIDGFILCGLVTRNEVKPGVEDENTIEFLTEKCIDSMLKIYGTDKTFVSYRFPQNWGVVHNYVKKKKLNWKIYLQRKVDYVDN